MDPRLKSPSRAKPNDNMKNILALILCVSFCSALYSWMAPTPMITLRTSYLEGDPQAFKTDLMLVFDASLTKKVITEEISIAGKILQLYEKFDTRFKVGEISSETESEGTSIWVTKANHLFSKDGILSILPQDKYSSESRDILKAIEVLQSESRADCEKSIIILGDIATYDAYSSNKTLIAAFKKSNVRASWVSCQENSVTVSCQILPHQSSHWIQLDYEKLGPSVIQHNIEGSNVEVTVFLRQYPVRFDQPLPIRMEIKNKDLVSTIDPKGYIYFPGNSYTKKTYFKLDQVLGSIPKAKFHLDIDLEVHSHLSYRDIPETIHFELRDHKGIAVPTTANVFSFRSDMLAKNLMDWSSDQLKLHQNSILDYLPESLTNILETLQIVPPKPIDLINVCFFGVVGSGKSTTQNTLMTSLRTDEFVETMRPAGGGSDHVTVRIEGVDLTQSIKRSNIRMRFWDSFGVSVDNWPDTKFREFLNGRLSSYSVDDEQAPSDTENSSSVQVPLRDRIHSVLLFMPAEIFKNEQLFSRMVKSSKIAVSEGYNPLLMVTFINDLTAPERESLKELIISNFNVPKHQVIFVPYYGERETRDFKTDFESLYILDRIRNSAESFLESHYPTSSERLTKRSLIIITIAAITVIKIAMSLIEKLKRSRSAPVECAPINTSIDEESEEEEDTTVVIRYIQSSMQIRVKCDTKLKDIVSNVAKTFQVEETNTVFVDEEGVQYQFEAPVLSCDKIYVKVLTTM